MKFIAMYGQINRPIIYIQAEDINGEKKWMILNSIQTFELDKNALNWLEPITDKAVLYHLLESHNLRLDALYKSTENESIKNSALNNMLDFKLDFGNGYIIEFPNFNKFNFNRPVEI